MSSKHLNLSLLVSNYNKLQIKAADETILNKDGGNSDNIDEENLIKQNNSGNITIEWIVINSLGIDINHLFLCMPLKCCFSCVISKRNCHQFIVSIPTMNINTLQ